MSYDLASEVMFRHFHTVLLVTQIGSPRVGGDCTGA